MKNASFVVIFRRLYSFRSSGFLSSTNTAFVVMATMNNVNANVTTKPANKYFISASHIVDATCMGLLSARNGQYLVK